MFGRETGKSLQAEGFKLRSTPIIAASQALQDTLPKILNAALHFKGINSASEKLESLFSWTLILSSHRRRGSAPLGGI